MTARDTRCGYGWVSIALHWTTVVIVLAMLTLGSLSQPEVGHVADASLIRLHTSIGIAAYALLWGRIAWRFAMGHPGPLPTQGRLLFSLGRYFHYALLIALGAMLVSGPLLAWASGEPIHVFAVSLPSPIGEMPALRRLARTVHGSMATFIVAGLILHVLAVFKHTVIDRDGTFDKIMVADKRGANGA